MDDLAPYYDKAFEQMPKPIQNFIVYLIHNNTKDFNTYFVTHGISYIRCNNIPFVLNIYKDSTRIRLDLDGTGKPYPFLLGFQKNPAEIGEVILSFDKPVMLFFKHLIKKSETSFKNNYFSNEIRTNNFFNIDTKINDKPETVEAGSVDIFRFPLLHMTGHGNVFFDDTDVENLRNYLSSGGFLHISDNYGLDKYIRSELEKLFPELELQEISYDHAIYNQTYKFESLPKIHEHDGNAPQGFGLFREGRLVLFYDYESDLNDGWEDEAVHNNPEPIREKALQMGANIIEYVFKH